MTELYTADEAAELLEISPRTIYNLVRDRKLRPCEGHNAATWRFSRESIDARIAQRAVNIQARKPTSVLPKTWGVAD